jgi:hypothetical protein
MIATPGVQLILTGTIGLPIPRLTKRTAAWDAAGGRDELPLNLVAARRLRSIAPGL